MTTDRPLLEAADTILAGLDPSGDEGYRLDPITISLIVNAVVALIQKCRDKTPDEIRAACRGTNPIVDAFTLMTIRGAVGREMARMSEFAGNEHRWLTLRAKKREIARSIFDSAGAAEVERIAEVRESALRASA